MKDETIQLKYDSDHLDALRMFLGEKGLTLEGELAAHLDTLLEKHVPRQVVAFLLNRPAKPSKPPRPRPKPKPPASE
jgi:hypothetical protein